MKSLRRLDPKPETPVYTVHQEEAMPILLINAAIQILTDDHFAWARRGRVSDVFRWLNPKKRVRTSMEPCECVDNLGPTSAARKDI